jgi:hypothetical protein
LSRSGSSAPCAWSLVRVGWGRAISTGSRPSRSWRSCERPRPAQVGLGLPLDVVAEVDDRANAYSSSAPNHTSQLIQAVSSNHRTPACHVTVHLSAVLRTVVPIEVPVHPHARSDRRRRTAPGGSRFTPMVPPKDGGLASSPCPRSLAVGQGRPDSACRVLGTRGAHNVSGAGV